MMKVQKYIRKLKNEYGLVAILVVQYNYNSNNYNAVCYKRVSVNWRATESHNL